MSLPIAHLPEEFIQTCYEHLVSTHSDIGLSPEAFRRRLLQIVNQYLPPQATLSEAVGFAETLHVSEIGLCLACSLRSETAWTRLRSLYKRPLTDIFRTAGYQSYDCGDAAESLLIDLFLPDTTGRSRLASYSGRSTLATWLRVVAGNRILNDRIKQRREFLCIDDCAQLRDPSALRIVEHSVNHSRYAAAIREALGDALRRLSARDRLILRLRYEDGLALGRIAESVGVHQSNVTRRLGRTIAQLRGHVARSLSSEHALSSEAVSECFDLVPEVFGDAPVLAAISGSVAKETSAIRLPRARQEESVSGVS